MVIILMNTDRAVNITIYVVMNERIIIQLVIMGIVSMRKLNDVIWLLMLNVVVRRLNLFYLCSIHFCYFLLLINTTHQNLF